MNSKDHGTTPGGHNDGLGEPVEVEMVTVMDDVTLSTDDDGDGHGGGGHDDRGHKTAVSILVNKQRVVIHEPTATGAEIKQAAIAQGVHIEAAFVLSVEHGGRHDIVGDNDTVHLHNGLVFLAVHGDDNS